MKHFKVIWTYTTTYLALFELITYAAILILTALQGELNATQTALTCWKYCNNIYMFCKFLKQN